ncbi:isochorismatase family protein, partial [Escherichia coli]|nr:isochorismatase family protein [Escherichia coli]
IDCQNTYREGIMQLTGVEPALKEARRVLDRARALGRPVIHIQHDAGPGTPYDVRADIGRIADIVAPQNGETVITKGYP